MKTFVLPIKNMCGYPVGSGMVTVNALGNYTIDPLSRLDPKNMSYLVSDSYIHFGCWKIPDKNKTFAR